MILFSSLLFSYAPFTDVTINRCGVEFGLGISGMRRLYPATPIPGLSSVLNLAKISHPAPIHSPFDRHLARACRYN